MNLNDFKNISIEYLMDTKLGQELQNMLDSFQKVQEFYYHLKCSEDSGDILKLKAGTALTFAILNQIIRGKNPIDFTEQDWKNIADTVVGYTVCMDGKKYTECVFLTYAEYIALSTAVIGAQISPEMVQEITSLADELRGLSASLESGKLDEKQYIEQCLWISLEAMLKLLAAMIGIHGGPEIAHFVDGLSMYALEYGRMLLYQREQEILTNYISHQKHIDEKLKEEYQRYLQDLQTQSECFMNLVNHAFSPDFRTSLKSSVELARKAGVPDQEILKSKEEIDDFFLS